MTASFPAVHFFYDSVIISREHLKRSTCQRNCVYFTTLVATIHYNKRSLVDLRKIEEHAIHPLKLQCICFCRSKDGNHPLLEVYCAGFIRCTTAVTRCNPLSFIVTRCHSLSLVLSLVIIRCHSLSFFVTHCTTRCHSLSLDVSLVCLFINDFLMYKKSNSFVYKFVVNCQVF